MKKLFLGLSLVAGTFIFAQKKPSFGIKGGANLSSISNNDYDAAKNKFGFNAGVFMNAPLSEKFNLQPEVIYTQYGAKSSYKEDAGSTTNKSSSSANLDYVAVPVMVQFLVTPEFYFEAGPEFGVLVSAKYKNKSETSTVNGDVTNTESDSKSTNAKDDFKTFNFGAALGLGYYFTKNIGVNARYVAGFTNIVKDNKGSSVRNNTFQLGLTYKF